MFADALHRAVPKSNQPQPPAQELEAAYKTLAEGLISSKERSKLQRQQSNKQKQARTITIINTDALDKVNVPLDRLKNLWSLALAKALTASARLPEAVPKSNQPQPSAQELEAAYKTLPEGLIRSRERNTDALNKIHLWSLALAKALTAGARLAAYKTLAEVRLNRLIPLMAGVIPALVTPSLLWRARRHRLHRA